MLDSPYLLILGLLLFTFSCYYLLKVYLVEWGCRTFLISRVKIVDGDDGDTVSGVPSASTTSDDDKAKKCKERLTSVTRGDLAEIAQLMVSQVITAATGVVSVLAMLETRQDCLHSKSPLLVTFVHIPAWYMLYDVFAMFDAFTLRKRLKHLPLGKQLTIYAQKKSGLIFHHAILFLCGYPLVLSYNVRAGTGDFIIALFFLMELTNPFLSMTMILKILGLTRTRFYFANGVILLLLWFLLRVLNYPIALLVYAAQYHGWNVLSALGTMKAICHPFCLLHFGFQTYWFYQIFKISVRTTFSKSDKTS